MKYTHLPYRFLLVVFSLIVFVSYGIAIALLLGWTIPTNFMSAFKADPANRWGAIVTCVFILIMSLQLLSTAFRRRREHEIIIQETGLGRVEIAATALENVIRRAARQVRDVREVKPVLRCDRDGLGIFLHLNVNPEAHIPSVTQEIQQIVQEYLEEKVGVHVIQVGVRVDSVSIEPRARVE